MKIKFLKNYENAKAGDVAEFSDVIVAKGLLAEGYAVEYKDEPQVITANVDSIAISDAVCKGIEKLMGQKSTVVDAKPEKMQVKTVGDLTKKFIVGKTVNITTNTQGQYAVTENNKEIVSDLLKVSKIVSKVPTVTLSDNENVWKLTIVDSMGTAPAVYGESGPISLSTQTVAQVSIPLRKIAYFFKTTHEAERDLSRLIDVIMGEVPVAYANILEKAMVVNGTLSNVIGIVGHAQTTVVPGLGAGQAAGTWVPQNARDMLVASKNPEGSVWLMSPGAWAQTMAFENSTGSGALFVNQNGMADAPAGTLLGQPIYVNRTSGIAVGTVGDVILADLSKYKFAVKGMQIDQSIEKYFDTAEIAYRYMWDIAGGPIGVKLATGEGDFVVCDTRTGS